MNTSEIYYNTYSAFNGTGRKIAGGHAFTWGKSVDFVAINTANKARHKNPATRFVRVAVTHYDDCDATANNHSFESLIIAAP